MTLLREIHGPTDSIHVRRPRTESRGARSRVHRRGTSRRREADRTRVLPRRSRLRSTRATLVLSPCKPSRSLGSRPSTGRRGRFVSLGRAPVRRSRVQGPACRSIDVRGGGLQSGRPCTGRLCGGAPVQVSLTSTSRVLLGTGRDEGGSRSNSFWNRSQNSTAFSAMDSGRGSPSLQESRSSSAKIRAISSLVFGLITIAPSVSPRQ